MDVTDFEVMPKASKNILKSYSLIFSFLLLNYSNNNFHCAIVSGTKYIQKVQISAVLHYMMNLLHKCLLLFHSSF